MKTNFRIIFVGKAASGKTYWRDKFREKGLIVDISYTTREKRKNETHGKDYYFIPLKDFKTAIDNNLFYEYIKFNNNYYGTGLKEWNESDIFIMEPSSINKLSEKDRKNSIIIYLNPNIFIRLYRLLKRKMSIKKTIQRLIFDYKLFKNFKNYDIKL